MEFLFGSLMQMHHNNFSFYRFLFWIAVVAITAGISISIIASLGRSDIAFLNVAISWCKTYIWLSSVLTAIFLLCLKLRNTIGEPWVWKFVQKTLNIYQRKLFVDSIPVGDHRITIFMKVAWAFPWQTGKWNVLKKYQRPKSGWLVPVVRSGHVTQRNITIFRCPDHPDFAEGIAGAAFAGDDVVQVDNLPDLSDNCTEEMIKEYSSKTLIDPEVTKKRVKQQKTNARSFYAFVIRKGDDPWGVVVLDSRSPAGIRMNTIKNQTKILTEQLGCLLEVMQ